MIHPPTFPKFRENETGEKLVFEALKRLPDSFEVFYHIPIFFSDSNGQVFDKEIDFLVADLREGRFNGLLIIEAKSGAIRFRAESNSWTQNGEDKGDWISKLNGVKHSFAKYFNNYLSKVEVGYCFFFSTSQDVNQLHAPGLLPEQIIDYTGCLEPEQTIINRFDILRETHLSRPGDELSRFIDLKHILLKESRFVETLRSHVDLNNRTFNFLTEHQWNVFKGLRRNNCILVNGCAGSGKTMLALKYARLLDGDGNRVLFLCFNRYLANNLKQQLSADENIFIDTFHSFAEYCIRKADPLWWDSTMSGYQSAGNLGEFFSVLVPEKFLKTPAPEKFGALIIDEGQDFEASWYSMLYSHLHPAAKVSVFMDPMQDIFNRFSHIPVYSQNSFVDFELSENCRNTNQIREFINKKVGIHLLGMPSSPNGPLVKELGYSNPIDLAVQLTEVLIDMTQPGNLRAEEIVILVNEKENKAIKKIASNVEGPIRLRQLISSELREPGFIYCTSSAVFKGMEAEAVIIIDPPTLDADEDKTIRSRKVLYTQLSRAKSVLVVFEKTTAGSIDQNKNL